ncbi:CIA30 family protein [Lacinutrix sp. Bg11-31]|uniref:CIA30 family protein n=1 Tax=Lacinutrix sp. Bg11-31 TaxID=2057808 RepID=UPI000C301D63|nr:CIA30 family protein [Lacinutrix sp. Bg11-31]AUC81860.1 CIA30 family protein [Lacinutrix sp. Bg11-31]
MKPLALILLFTTIMTSTPIFNFTKDANISNWRIIDDVVMGGRSNGNFALNNNGHGVFSGEISLENNGGFSSLRYDTETIAISKHTKVCIKLKGDSKDYQFRIKANRKERYSYITTFKTSGEWETITINLKDMYPAFRGRTLDYPSFDKTNIEELAFLIGNKKAESFELLIDSIELK